jgi:hypothetical protein
MKNLKELTPAQTLILTTHGKASLKDLLKYTLLDLLMKKVLVAEEEGDEESKVHYLRRGENFLSYHAEAHEHPFLKLFEDDPDIVLTRDQLIKSVVAAAISRAAYVHRRLAASTKLNQAFKQSFFDRLFGIVVLSDAGKSLAEKVAKELNELEELLPDLLANDHRRLREILTQLHGNVFLIPGFEPESLAALDEDFRKQLVGGDTYVDYFPFIYFDSYSSSFDDSFDAAGSSGEGGCGGDSGCSGCGGCGGCGS